ncbi:MAG TPA: SIMPL domain-containing protein [Polyangiaceae bacterium]|jgi:uncharacterized protein YggE|nr:SIMPL domain-containing protein [Polyangiaceae bacterium]
MKIHAISSFFRPLDVRCSLVALALPLVVAQAGCAAPHTVIHPGIPPAGAPVEGISVTGTGKAFGQPNIARATVGVEVRAATADVAMRDVSTGVARVIAALKGAGIAESDLVTQNLSLHFEREELPPPRPVVEPPAAPLKARPGTAPANDASLDSKKSPAGYYRAQNTVVVKIRNLDKVGAVLGAAVGAGANAMFGLAFQIEEPRPLEEQAREKAMADARARAEGLARLAGVRLGPIVSIQESNGGGPSPGPVMMYKAAQAADVPIERGELLVTTTVNTVYSIAK